MKAHPHAEATYEVVPLGAGGFVVRVSIPDTNPTTVSGFATQDAAEAWVAAHKDRVRTNSRPGTMVFGRSKPLVTGRQR